MSTTPAESPSASSNRRANRKPDFQTPDGNVAVWTDKHEESGKTFASISYGPEGKRQSAKANCDVAGLDQPLSAQEIACMFQGIPVVVQLQPRDATKPLYDVTLCRTTDSLTAIPWKNDATKFNHYMDIGYATHVYRQKKNEDKTPKFNEKGEPEMRLAGYRIGKGSDKVEYPARLKHGTGTWVGINGRDALYLANNQPVTINWNGQDYNLALLGIKSKEGNTPGKVFLNADISITKPGESVDQSRSAAVDYDQTNTVGTAEENEEAEASMRGQNVPF